MEIKTVPLQNGAYLTAYLPDAQTGYQVYKTRPGILLAPGGSYLYLATRESEGIALEFLGRGFNVYLIHYSVGFTTREARENNTGHLDTDHHFPQPALEMLEAIHLLKTNAKEMNLDPDALFLMGFSAGGHLCGTIGTMWNDPDLISQLDFVPEGNELKAAGMVLAYPMIHPMSDTHYFVNDPQEISSWLMKDFLFQTRKPSDEQMESVNLITKVSDETVPAFVWQCEDDPIVNPLNSTEFVLALQKHGIPCEYQLFDHGGHGLGLAKELYAKVLEEIDDRIAQWPDAAEAWMKRIIKTQK